MKTSQELKRHSESVRDEASILKFQTLIILPGFTLSFFFFFSLFPAYILSLKPCWKFDSLVTDSFQFYKITILFLFIFKFFTFPTTNLSIDFKMWSNIFIIWNIEYIYIYNSTYEICVFKINALKTYTLKIYTVFVSEIFFLLFFFSTNYKINTK